MARRHRRHHRRHLHGLGDIGDFGLGAVVSGQQIKSMLLGSTAAAGGILGVGAITRRIPVSPAWRSFIAIPVGMILGRMLWRLDVDAAKGVTYGAAGLGIASLISTLSGGAVSVGLGYNPNYGWGVGQPGAHMMNWGVGRTRVVDGQAGAPTLGRTRVESRNENEFALADVGKWIS